jgi:hypothetical protein
MPWEESTIVRMYEPLPEYSKMAFATSSVISKVPAGLTTILMG